MEDYSCQERNRNKNLALMRIVFGPFRSNFEIKSQTLDMNDQNFETNCPNVVIF